MFTDWSNTASATTLLDPVRVAVPVWPFGPLFCEQIPGGFLVFASLRMDTEPNVGRVEFYLENASDPEPMAQRQPDFICFADDNGGGPARFEVLNIDAAARLRVRACAFYDV